MRPLFLHWLAIATCQACARTRGGGGGPSSATPGSPAPGSPGGETPGPATEAPPKICPPLMAFAPDPAAFQLVSPPTTAVSGDTTTATCPASGTSFLLSDGSTTTATTLSCSTATGVWSFSDNTAFDATITSIACGAKCAACMITQIDFADTSPPTVTDSTDQCNTPNSPTCDNSIYPTLFGANMDGTRFVGSAIVEPVACVGGRWVDASDAVYENLGCNVKQFSCGDADALVDVATCTADTGTPCVRPTSIDETTYSGTNALLIGVNTITIVCPAEAPVLYLSITTDGTPTTLNLNMPLSDADANFVCESGKPYYLNGGIATSSVTAYACAPA